MSTYLLRGHDPLLNTRYAQDEFARRLQGFADLDAARIWAAGFVRWYNLEHRHSGIRYVTPEQRHCGQDHAILAARHALYTQARALTPARWSRHTRNWKPVLIVTLNPERGSIIKTHLEDLNLQPLAA